jgi:hypothetical protein
VPLLSEEIETPTISPVGTIEQRIHSRVLPAV